MFDTSPPTDQHVALEFDLEVMVALLGRLDDSELALIEDDLDFYHFTGSPSPRLRGLLDQASGRAIAA